MEASQNLETVAPRCSKIIMAVLLILCQLSLKPIKRDKFLFKEMSCHVNDQHADIKSIVMHFSGLEMV